MEKTSQTKFQWDFSSFQTISTKIQTHVGVKLRRARVILGLLDGEAKAYVALSILFGLFDMYIENKKLFGYNNMLKSLEAKDLQLFYGAIYQSMLFTFFKAVFGAVRSLLNYNISLTLTSKLSATLLHKYFDEKIYYEARYKKEATKMQLDEKKRRGQMSWFLFEENYEEDDFRAFNRNTIQKTLQRDVSSFLGALMRSLIQVLSPLTHILVGVAFLLELMSWQFLLSATILVSLFSVGDAWFNKLHEERKNEIQQNRSKMNNSINRLAINAEEMAFWNGAGVEMKRVDFLFKAMYTKMLAATKMEVGYNFIKVIESNSLTILVYIVFHRQFFTGELALSDLQLINHFFHKIIKSISRLRRSIVSVLTNISHTIDPLYYLAKPRDLFMDYVRPIKLNETDPSGSALLVVRNLSIRKFDQVDNSAESMPRELPLMIRDLNFEVKAGDRLLIQGKNGAGKTTLFRAFANLLPLSMFEPGFTIECLQRHQVLFVSQRTFLLANLSIKEQVLYPTWVAEFNLSTEFEEEQNESENRKGRKRGRGQILWKEEKKEPETREPQVFLPSNPQNTRPVPSDEEILEVLCLVGLKERIKPSLETLNNPIKNWSVFSGGEKEMITFARLLLAKPRLAFLDEVTAGLALEIEDTLYSTLDQNKDLTYVSIGHRSSLVQYHNKKLTTKDGNKWKVEPLLGNKEPSPVDGNYDI